MNESKVFYTRTYADGTEQRFSIEDYEKNVLPTLGKGGEFDDEDRPVEKENKLDIVRQKFLEPISFHAYTSGYGNFRGVKVRIKDHLANWDNFYLYDLPNLREGESPYLLSVVINDDFDKNTVSAYYGKSASNIEDFEIEYENEFPDLKAVELVFGKDDRVEDIIWQIEFEIDYMTKGKQFAKGGQFHLGGDMSVHLAPNGKPSNLTHEQWHLVRTPEFKNWFGDWEEAYLTGDYEGVSKVIDENGDPLVCYHGSNAEFNVFELFKGTFRSGKINSFGHYFTDRLRASYYGKIVKGYFLNARNPKFLNSFQDYYLWVRYDLGVSDKKTIREIDNDVNGKIAKIIVKNKFDGLVVKAPLPKHRYSLNDPYNKETDVNYIVYKPTQIKLADGTNTTFDGSNPDIRFAEGGEFDDGSENFGKPPVEYSEIPFIHETRKDVAQKILKSGFIVGTNPVITKGIYTIPIVWKNEKFDKTANTQELAVWLKDGIKIFWTNSERPTDYYRGYGNKFYQNLYRRLNKGYKSPKEDWSNKEYQEGFSRRMENWLKDNGYVGVQQGGEIVITDLKAIDYVEAFNRHEESKPDIRYAKGGVFPSLITSYSQLGW